MPIQRTHIASLGIAALLACAIPAFAQELQPLVAEREPEPQENRYRIGIDCSPAPEALRAHLPAIREHGLIVNGVMDESPAGRSGVKRFDVISKADGQPLKTVHDLVHAVNQAQEKEMELAIIRDGKESVVRLTPEPRDEEEIQRLRQGFADRLGAPGQFGQFDFRQGFGPMLGPGFAEAQEELERALQRMQQLGPMNRGWRRINPGIMLDEEENQLPDGFNLSMQVQREGDGPAKITVQRGNEQWEVTENDLDELPEDVRPLVENMLHGRRFGIRGFRGPRLNAFPPGSGKAPAQPRTPSPRAPRAQERLQNRFDGLELKMQELQDAIRAIQEDE